MYKIGLKIKTKTRKPKILTFEIKSWLKYEIKYDICIKNAFKNQPQKN